MAAQQNIAHNFTITIRSPADTADGYHVSYRPRGLQGAVPFEMVVQRQGRAKPSWFAGHPLPWAWRQGRRSLRAPYLFADVDPSAALAQHEIFRPEDLSLLNSGTR